MPSPFRFAGIITVLFAACGAARAQELAPPGSDVSIHKQVIENGSSHTVKYYVRGGRRGFRPWSAASNGPKTS
jgi:hypothetical protein